MDTPPPLSLSFPTYVVTYAIVDGSVTFHDRKTLWAGDGWLGAVPKLAICRNPRTNEYHLSHCDEDWDELCCVETSSTLAGIKAQAERRYEGIGTKWRSTGYSEAEAEAYFRVVESEHKCSFCDKSLYDGNPESAGGMVVKDSANICYDCIKAFSKAISRDST